MLCRAVLLIGLIVLSGPCRAALQSVADPVFGAGALVRDSATGLEFLGLRLSRGLSHAQVVAQMAAGGVFSSYHYATVLEAETLFQDAGVTVTAAPTFYPSEFTGGELLLSLLGTLYNSGGNLSLTAGLTSTLAAPGTGAYDTITLIDCYTSTPHVCSATGAIASATEAQLGSMPGSQPYTYLGSFLIKTELVQAVPEPGSLLTLATLLGLGCCASSWARAHRMGRCGGNGA